MQVICRAQSTNLTAPPAPPEPSVSTPVTQLVSSVNETSAISANQTATARLSVNQTAFISVNQTASIMVNQTAISLNPSAVTASSPVASATSGIIESGGRKRRRRSILSNNMLQYQFNTSAGKIFWLSRKYLGYSQERSDWITAVIKYGHRVQCYCLH